MSIDRVAALSAFVRVAEARGFTRAAEQLGVSRARVSRQIAQLEDHLGVRLLYRTTRQVTLTEDGRLLVDRSRDWLDDLDDIEARFDRARGALSGRVRVDMNHAMARDLVIPRLPAFLDTHPGLSVELSTSDDRIDPVRDGLDCVVRVGTLTDSQLIARPLGQLPVVNCASPMYLARRGTPRRPPDLCDGHAVIHYVPHLGNTVPRWEYRDGDTARFLDLPGTVTVNGTMAYTEACLAGLGLIQVPRVGVQRYLAEGRLVEVLADYRPEPLPVSLLYPHRRNLSRRVQVVMDWLGEQIQSYYLI